MTETMRKNDRGKIVMRILSACRRIFLSASAFLIVCTLLFGCVFLTAYANSYLPAYSYLSANSYLPANFYVHGQENIPVRQAAAGMVRSASMAQAWEEELPEREEEAAWRRAYLYIICNMQEYLDDPYHNRMDSEKYHSMDQLVYLGIHDFDGDGIPELLAGDTITMAVFTFAGGRVEKLADLYYPNTACWCINGVYFKDNSVSVSCDGQDGSDFVDFGFLDNNGMKGFATRYYSASGRVSEEAREEIRLVHEETGWVLKFRSGEEAALDSGFDYDLIRW